MKPVLSNIILGIDPGTIQMGYSIIDTNRNNPQLLSMGTLLLSSQKDMYKRLGKIHSSVKDLIELYTPSILAIEAPFYGKNVQSMLKLGRAQGIAIAVALQYGLTVTEYSPKKVKQSITGNGSASKEQVWKMLQRIFYLEETPKYYDASDALAVAMCHYHQLSGPVTFNTSKNKRWEDFLVRNPDKIIK